MASRLDVVSGIEHCGVVAVIRLRDGERLRGVVDALIDGGVRAMEVTMTVPGAVGLIEGLAQDLPKGFILGAGTVLDPETARQVILAGAQFLVSPILSLPTIEMAHRYDVAIMPGCFTPTEILAGWQAGADAIKVFPATTLGPGYIKDVKAPLPQVKLLPTGGVSLTNAGDWIRAGACAVGVGSALLDAKAIDQGRFEVIADNARTLVASVAAARA